MEADVNRVSCRALGIAMALISGPAAAADLPGGYPSPYVAAGPYGVYNWTGTYVGGNLGYQWGGVANLPLQPSGINGGVQAGYNWQTGQFVVGVETDIQVSSADDRFAAYQYSNPWFGTTRARAGIAFSNVVLYATAGLAYGGEKLNFVGITESHADLGWSVGGGIEVGLTQNWSARAEYLYFDLGGQNYVLTGVNNGLSTGMIRLGINYRF
jgi:outer membrane immunogenic protein